MNEHIVLAAQIEWTGGTVYVTDTTLRIDAALLEDAQFEPRILGGIRWGESARHPYQQQAGELVVGDLSLANADGGLDALATGDVVGATVNLRRGSDADRWADLEFVFTARVSGVRLNGRSEIVLELENVLAALAGPVFSDKFASTVPNPQLEGKDIPLVLGKVKQAPVLEFNPATLTFYTATNASKIGQVAEGGNPTQRWTLEDQPTFNLLGSPTLPITADFEGPSDVAPVDILASIGSFDSWTDGTPNGWLKSTLGAGSFTEVASGIQITGVSANSATAAAIPDVVSESVGAGIQAAWVKNGAAFSLFDPGGASITIGDSETPQTLLLETGFGPGAGNYNLGFDASSTASGQAIERIDLVLWDSVSNSEIAASENIVNIPLESALTAVAYPITAEAINAAFGVITNTDYRLYFRLFLRKRSGTVVVENLLFTIVQRITNWAVLKIDSLLNDGIYSLEIDHEASATPLLVQVGESPNTGVFPDWANPNHIFNLGSSAGTTAATVTVKNGTLAFAFQSGETSVNATQTINQIRLINQPPSFASYKTLAPYILTTAGIDPGEHLDQPAINAHADSFADPDLGWLVKGDETVDQILFRLAGSLGGYVWHGLDGKVRSKRLALPTDPGGTPFVIDSSRADIDEISAYDDPAPQLTTRVNALRNWRPIDPDRQAGITSTWSESDRAAAAAEWRITRAWDQGEAEALFKRHWPGVAGREPYGSALLESGPAQALVSQAELWLDRPRFYEVPCEVLIGELDQVAVGQVVRVELDYPGLNGAWLLVMGREGDARPGTVNLTLWG